MEITNLWYHTVLPIFSDLFHRKLEAEIVVLNLPLPYECLVHTKLIKDTIF